MDKNAKIYGILFLVILYVYFLGDWMAEHYLVDLTYDKEKRDIRNLNDNYRITKINDVFISVKTTNQFHKTRIQLLLDTWWIFAQDQVYFFSDHDDSELYRKTKGHFVNTNCTSGHDRDGLCCKMSVEFDYFILSYKSWFCHVDDDNYINIPALLELLQKYNNTQRWYLGKPSLNHPMQAVNPDNRNGPKISFWFAHGGAGFCISRPLALKMVPYVGGGRFKQQCSKIGLPDDCTMGYIIDYCLHENLTVIPEFHSHYERMSLVDPHQLHKQISLSYAANDKTIQGSAIKTGKANILQLQGLSKEKDPTRMLSIHCHLNPYLEQCPKKKN